MTLLGQRARASVNAFTKETFSGIQITKTFRREKKVYNNFLEVNNQSYRVNLKRAFFMNSIFPTTFFKISLKVLGAVNIFL